MTAVLTQPRQTRSVPRRGETQGDFVARSNRELYRKIPDALKRNRYILKCWREAGRDGELTRMAAERFPENKFQTVHDLPIFPEHSTVGSDGKKRVYDRKALEVIVNACNNRILDTGDFSALTAGHTPDDPTSAHAVVPEVLGYEGPFRLGMIGNLRPKWCIFADEHHRRDKLAELEHKPRRSAEVWLEDNILDPIAALGAETPRLDTGIVRNCRLPNGRTVQKYSAVAAYPGGMNTSPQSFGKKSRETYAAGDSSMQDNNTMPGSGSDTEALQGLPDETVTRIIQGVAGMLMQSKLMQWVQSQMPEDWTPGEAADDEIPPEHADLDEEMGSGYPGDDVEFSPADGAELSDVGGDSPPDVGATVGSEVPDDEATPDEVDVMDDEDKERYAAHDSAGRKGFLQAWRKHNRQNKSMYSAAGGNSMSRTGQPESYSRLKADNEQLQQRVDQLEARDRHRDRYSRLANLHRTHEFNLDTEFADVKDSPQEQFDRHCQRIKENYSRRAVPMGEFTPKLPVDGPEKIEGQDEQAKKVDRYSRRAMEIASDALKINPRVGMTWDEAFAQAVKEIDGHTVATT